MSGQDLVPASQQVITVHSDETQRLMPALSLELALERRNAIVKAVEKLLRPSTKDAKGTEQADGDYGVIPGTKKPTLLQPGADKLNNLFGLIPTFEVVSKDLDWTGERHGGEPFFYYEVKCRLMRGSFVMGEGDGSANSWESKYRYRKTERVCPVCGKAAIIKGRKEYGGGWLCFKKNDGCGAKFLDGAEEIESQITGTTPNPNIADVVNTVQKIANKRSKIAATLNATSAHEFFTQDLEDYQPEFHPEFSDDGGPKSSATEGKQPTQPNANAKARQPFDMAKMITSITAMKEQIGKDAYYRILGTEGYEHANEIRTREDGVRVFQLMRMEQQSHEADAKEDWVASNAEMQSGQLVESEEAAHASSH